MTASADLRSPTASRPILAPRNGRWPGCYDDRLPSVICRAGVRCTLSAVAAAVLLSALASCAGPRAEGTSPSSPLPAPPPALTAREISDLIPERVADRHGWSEVILDGLVRNGVRPERTSVCAVIAVIGQESGFQENPVVPGLARIVRARVDRYKTKLGPLGDPLLERLLDGHAPNDPRSFTARMDTVRTERDVDLLFRDLLSYYQANHPALMELARWAGKLVDLDDLTELDPITTAGSMQVSVRFATEWARDHEGAAAPGSVRDALYTRAGGVYYGAARLLDYPSHYPLPLYRFADYNAGYYASRNAAVQAQLVQLTGLPLALDGDLLAYERNGDPSAGDSASERAVQAFARRFAPELTPRQIRDDLLQEKTLAFEGTETYRAIKAAVSRRGGRPDEYARLPDLALVSPKLSRPLSTAWFARAVDRRYQACLGVQSGDAQPRL